MTTPILPSLVTTEGWQVLPWNPPPTNPPVTEAISLLQPESEMVVRMVVMNADGTLVVQAAGERKKPLTKPVFLKILRKLAPKLEWKYIDAGLKDQAHAFAVPRT